MPLKVLEKKLEKELEGKSDLIKYNRYQKLAQFYIDDKINDRAVYFLKKSMQFKTRYNYAELYFKIFDLKMSENKSITQDLKELEQYIKKNPKKNNHSIEIKRYYYMVISSGRPSYEIINKKDRDLIKFYNYYNRKLTVYDLNHSLKNGHISKAKETFENYAKRMKDPIFILYKDIIYKPKELACKSYKKSNTNFKNLCLVIEDKKNKARLLNDYSQVYRPLVELMKNHLYN